MKNIIIVICTLMLFINCSNKMNNEPQAELTYLALGDSYTIGESVDSTKRWPVQLAVQLRKAAFNITDPKIIAQTGWTTSELQNAIEAEQVNSSYDLVSLLIGVNNQYRRLSIDQYRQEFRQLLQQAIGFAGNKPQNVIVLSIPDWSVMPFAQNHNRQKIAQEIDAFNAVNLQESQKADVHYIDITPVSRNAQNDSSLIAPDGLHPSADMYAAWVEQVIPVVQGIF